MYPSSSVKVSVTSNSSPPITQMLKIGNTKRHHQNKMMTGRASSRFCFVIHLICGTNSALGALNFTPPLSWRSSLQSRLLYFYNKAQRHETLLVLFIGHIMTNRRLDFFFEKSSIIATFFVAEASLCISIFSDASLNVWQSLIRKKM